MKPKESSGFGPVRFFAAVIAISQTVLVLSWVNAVGWDSLPNLKIVAQNSNIAGLAMLILLLAQYLFFICFALEGLWGGLDGLDRLPTDGLKTERHANGEKLSEGEYKNGKREGVWTFWNQDGSIVHHLSGVYKGRKRIAPLPKKK